MQLVTVSSRGLCSQLSLFYPLSALLTLFIPLVLRRCPQIPSGCNSWICCRATLRREQPAPRDVSRRVDACLGTTGGGGQGDRVPLKLMLPYNPWRRPWIPARLLARLRFGACGAAPRSSRSGTMRALTAHRAPSQPTQAVKRTLLLVGAASLFLAQPSAYGHHQRVRYRATRPPLRRVGCSGQSYPGAEGLG